jgi:hypothetical protein
MSISSKNVLEEATAFGERMDCSKQSQLCVVRRVGTGLIDQQRMYQVIWICEQQLMYKAADYEGSK